MRGFDRLSPNGSENMWHRLRINAGTPVSDIKQIEAIATRPTAGMISLRFVVTGHLHSLHIPEAEHPADQARRDELWRSTCFEAFVQPRDQSCYFEFNLSPSGHWAAYRFDSYRAGMKDAEVPHRTFRSDARRDDWYDISGSFAVPDLEHVKDWLVGLSAIIEEADGTRTYWALKHPPGKPDFHNADCFAARLAAPTRP